MGVKETGASLESCDTVGGQEAVQFESCHGDGTDPLRNQNW